MSTKSIGESIQSLFKQLGHEDKIKQYQVIQEWKKIVGEEISQVARPERIQDKSLIVRVASMSWRTELQMQKRQILQKIRDKVGDNVIVDIRFY
jgi:predicted nucleic acid-binding Zn ribbon protein